MSAGYKLRDGFRVSDTWEGRFACTLPDKVLEWWDLDKGTAKELAEGMARCRACPIVDQCRDEALAKKETGVFGGRVIVNGKLVPLATWLGRRSGMNARAQVVVARKPCVDCGDEFDIVAPKYTLKRCERCRIPRQNSIAAVAQATRAKKRRAEIAARLLEAEQPSA